ncbi:winged helix-turn-helix domain-containing protein [Actinophytocola sp.]|uniref:winged helix-turn-helix domain-containing protein n=1 Tax=Actinophytocola sp. TaxID=1872138 RepID=UPI002ED16E9F
MVFDRQDLQRVRLANAPEPMWELVLGLHKTQVRQLSAPLVGWRQEVERRVAGAHRGQHAMALLRHLIAPRGAFPDFLTPPGPVDLDAGCEAMLCTPRTRLVADLAAVFAHRAAPPWVASLARGDGKTMGEVVRAVRDVHALLVAPHWAQVCEVVAEDRVARARQLAEHGVGALLRNLPGVLGWDGQVLLTRYPVDRTVHLGGRGLVLMPSYFCFHSPITWLDPELPPVLVYQAHGDHPRIHDTVLVPDRLTSLLGRTRAECLRALLVSRSTSELATLLGISVGSASKQAAILRDTGLVTSNRQGPAVLHTTTPLGTALLIGERTDSRSTVHTGPTGS